MPIGSLVVLANDAAISWQWLNRSARAGPTPRSVQRKAYYSDARVIGIHQQLEAKFLVHLEHCLVFVQRSPFDDSQSYTARIFNHQPLEHPTQAVTFKVGAHIIREFTRFAIGIRVNRTTPTISPLDPLMATKAIARR